MKPFRGVFSARPNGDEPAGTHSLRVADPASGEEIAPGLVSPRPGPKHLLWEVLVELGFVDERRVLEAEAVARASRQDLGAVLLERGLVSGQQLARAVAQREGVLFADLETYTVDERAASMITPAVAERYGAIPIGFGPGGEVLLALSNPRERHAVNDISMMVEPSVIRVVATQEAIDALIQSRKQETYSDGDEAPAQTGGEGASAEEQPVFETAPDSDERLVAGEAAAPVEVGPAEASDDEGVADLFVLSGPVPKLEPATNGVEAPAGEEHDTPAEEPEDGAGSPAREAQPAAEAPTADVEPPAPAEPDLDDQTSGSGQAHLDRELLESLRASVEEVERLARESARVRDAELEAAGSEADRRLEELRGEVERERTEHAETERTLREQLQTERAIRDESERKLREDAEVERTAREQSERGLREELETERTARAESERGLREQLETERATHEALATEIAAVRTARDDLARRVAGARDLLETGARPFVPLNGRDR